MVRLQHNLRFTLNTFSLLNIIFILFFVFLKFLGSEHPRRYPEVPCVSINCEHCWSSYQPIRFIFYAWISTNICIDALGEFDHGYIRKSCSCYWSSNSKFTYSLTLRTQWKSHKWVHEEKHCILMPLLNASTLICAPFRWRYFRSSRIQALRRRRIQHCCSNSQDNILPYIHLTLIVQWV